MFPFNKWSRPLWFFGPATTLGSVDVNVSVVYNLSASISNFDRDIELSAFAFNLSVSFDPEDPNVEGLSVQVGIDLDDNTYSTVDLKASVTPVFVLSQSGQTDVSISAAYKMSVSVRSTIFPDVVPTLAYGMSASLSTVVLIANNIDVVLAYNLTASTNLILDVQTGDLTFDRNVACGLSCSIDPQVTILTGGGLVYSTRKQKYIPVGVGL